MRHLVEDCRRQDELYAAERAEHEKRYEAETAEQEKAAERRIEAMQMQMDVLIKMVGDSTKSRAEPSAGRPLGGAPQVKLVPLTEQDYVEAYLVTFERIMEAYTIPTEQWTYYLAPQLGPSRHLLHYPKRNLGHMLELRPQSSCDTGSTRKPTGGNSGM